jgi:hypothetical protein
MTNLFGSSYNLADNAGYLGSARQSAHHILYTVVNSAAMNGYVHGMRFVNGFAYYKFILIALDLLVSAGIVLWVCLLVKKYKGKN